MLLASLASVFFLPPLLPRALCVYVPLPFFVAAAASVLLALAGVLRVGASFL